MHKTKKSNNNKYIIFTILLILFLAVLMTNAINNTTAINNSFSVTNNLNRVIYKEGFYYEKLSLEIINKITGYSFTQEFNLIYTSIDYKDLVYVNVKYYDFNNNIHNNGELIVNSLVVQDIVEIFYKLYQNKYKFTSIKLVEDFNANDELSMENNNTSAFNYRVVENDDILSWHAFGLAVDINPLYNPYIIEDNIYPKTTIKYTDRSKNFEAKIDKTDLAYKLFTKYDWLWGGDFVNTKDYQHFYKELYNDEIREKKEDDNIEINNND